MVLVHLVWLEEVWSPKADMWDTGTQDSGLPGQHYSYTCKLNWTTIRARHPENHRTSVSHGISMQEQKCKDTENTSGEGKKQTLSRPSPGQVRLSFATWQSLQLDSCRIGLEAKVNSSLVNDKIGLTRIEILNNWLNYHCLWLKHYLQSTENISLLHLKFEKGGQSRYSVPLLMALSNRCLLPAWIAPGRARWVHQGCLWYGLQYRFIDKPGSKLNIGMLQPLHDLLLVPVFQTLGSPDSRIQFECCPHLAATTSMDTVIP